MQAVPTTNHITCPWVPLTPGKKSVYEAPTILQNSACFYKFFSGNSGTWTFVWVLLPKCHNRWNHYRRFTACFKVQWSLKLKGFYLSLAGKAFCFSSKSKFVNKTCFLQRLDIYRKVPQDLTEPTTSGAIISLVCVLVIISLLVVELKHFMALEMYVLLCELMSFCYCYAYNYSFTCLLLKREWAFRWIRRFRSWSNPRFAKHFSFETWLWR